MNETSNKMKEWVKIGGIVGGIIISSTSMVNQSSDSTAFEVRINAIEQNLSYLQNWKEKTEVKIDVTSKDVSALTIQLAQVLVKMDNIIESLKELKGK